MTRIFFSLAAIALLLLSINLLIGLSIGDYNGAVSRWVTQLDEVRLLERQKRADPEKLAAARARQDSSLEQIKPMRQRLSLHWMFGLSAALITILVNSVTVTYFIGTSRWCKEVCDAYQLDPALANQCTVLKRKTFPWAVTSMLVMVIVVALGAASEPGNSLVGRSSDWVNYHLGAALTALAAVAYSFIIQAQNIHANYALVQGLMDQVRQIRSDRGLEVNA